MRQIVLLLLAIGIITLVSCGGGNSVATVSYDGELCGRLANKVERNDSLSQQEYGQMIEQNEQILIYLVEQSTRLTELPEGERYGAYRELLADPAYMERFGYLFTLGSALYKADVEGWLNAENSAAYDALDEYNTRFSELSDRF